MTPDYQDATVTVFAGDCLDVLRTLPDASVDAVVTDPPYGLSFMGKEWDRPRPPAPLAACVECGNDDPAEGFTVCSDCLETLGHKGDQYATKAEKHGGRGMLGHVSANWHDKGTHSRGYADNDNKAFQAWCELWTAECLRVLKPGGHLLAFGGTRTWHRLACAVEDAGFEVRDSIAWMYGSGFPKSLDVSKAIDKAAGAERSEVVGRRGLNAWGPEAVGGSAMKDDGGIRQNFDRVDTLLAPATDAARTWQGWGTALKPSHEPVVVARKPLGAGTVAANVLAHGTGALNVDGCRVGMSDEDRAVVDKRSGAGVAPEGWGARGDYESGRRFTSSPAGRWPANVVLDGYREPVLRLRYNLPTEVERTIRESFGASTDHLPAMRDERDGAPEQGGASEVLLPRLPVSLDVGERDRRESAALRQDSHAGVDREDAGERERTDGASESAMDRRDVPNPGVCDGATDGTVAGGHDPLRLDGASEPIAQELRARASARGGADAGTAAALDGACASPERREGRQPAGEPGGSLGGGASTDARGGGPRVAALAAGERRATGSPLEVLRSECPPGWWHYFDVVAYCQSQAAALDEQSGELTSGANPTRRGSDKFRDAYGEFAGQEECVAHRGIDTGGASRFFYTAKADASERVRVNGTAHPTVKPLALMRWLVRLVTPPGGVVLEPFAGSGTTVEACILEGFRCIAIERESDYLPLIEQRIHRRRDPVQAVRGSGEDGGLFDLLDGGAA